MNNKIFALLIIFIAAISIASVSANEGFVSHDFNGFKMDIPQDEGGIFEKHNVTSGNATVYVVLNNDDSVFASVGYFNTSNTQGNSNVTDYILNNAEGNDMYSEGNITKWITDDGSTGYLLSSADDKECVLIFTNDTINVEQVLKTISFN